MEYVLKLGFVLLLVAGAFTVIGNALDTPVVQTSVETGKCVQVLQPPGSTYSCTNLPKRYRHEWVQ